MIWKSAYSDISVSGWETSRSWVMAMQYPETRRHFLEHMWNSVGGGLPNTPTTGPELEVFTTSLLLVIRWLFRGSVLYMIETCTWPSERASEERPACWPDPTAALSLKFLSSCANFEWLIGVNGWPIKDWQDDVDCVSCCCFLAPKLSQGHLEKEESLLLNSIHCSVGGQLYYWAF